VAILWGRLARTSVPYGLITRKQRNIEKIKIGIDVPQGMSKWIASFQVKRSKAKVTGRQKNTKLASWKGNWTDGRLSCQHSRRHFCWYYCCCCCCFYYWNRRLNDAITLRSCNQGTLQTRLGTRVVALLKTKFVFETSVWILKWGSARPWKCHTSSFVVSNFDHLSVTTDSTAGQL